MISILIIGFIYFCVKKAYDKTMANHLKDIEWIREHVSVEVNSNISNNMDIYIVKKNKNITAYNLLYQEVVNDYITEMIDERDNDVFMIYNPYSTNTNSINVYFTTDEEVEVSYTIKTDGYSDFSRVLKNDEEDNYETEHSYQLIGFIVGEKNELTLSLKDKDGNTKEKKYTIDLSNYKASAQNKLEVTKETKEEISDGLYAILGDSSDIDYIHLYDNDGYLRSEIPIIGYRAARLLFNDDKMYTCVSEKKLAEFNNLGQVTRIFKLSNYKFHHDYQFDTNKENILILATDTTNESCEDAVIKLNLDSGKITDSFLLEEIFPDLRKSAYYNESEVPKQVESVGIDWMHINTINYFENDTVILSSRETSSILKLSNIFDNPKIEYIIGDKKFWNNYGEKEYLLEKIGDFTIAGGQHTVTYVPTDEDGVYYLDMFNNNIGISMTVPNFDWSSIGLIYNAPEDDGISYYYRYKVDENNGTYELVNSFKVPYSAYMSSVQLVDDNIIVDSAQACVFSERKNNGKIIKSYKIDCNSSVYRVFKYTFSDFYFEG